MQIPQTNYLAAYRSLRLSRDANGTLVAEFHSNGGSFTGSGCSSEMLMSDSKVWNKKKRKMPSSLEISTPFRRSASALFSSHRLQLECPNPTSASRGSEQNQKG